MNPLNGNMWTSLYQTPGWDINIFYDVFWEICNGSETLSPLTLSQKLLYVFLWCNILLQVFWEKHLLWYEMILESLGKERAGYKWNIFYSVIGALFCMSLLTYQAVVLLYKSLGDYSAYLSYISGGMTGMNASDFHGLQRWKERPQLPSFCFQEEILSQIMSTIMYFSNSFVREHLNYYFAISLSSHFPAHFSEDNVWLFKQSSPNRKFSLSPQSCISTEMTLLHIHLQ